MNRTRCLLVAAIFAAFATGCFDIEESIDLKKDMSGTANLRLGVDMEPMITIMAMVQRGMEGKKGPPTKEEIAEAQVAHFNMVGLQRLPGGAVGQHATLYRGG